LTSLSSFLGALMAILQSHPVCEQATVVETKVFSSDQFFLKVRADLTGRNKFQARIYYNQGHIDYAYQLFADLPLLRWDNKEEFHDLETHPHHHHDEQGNVRPSTLTGDPVRDIVIVLDDVTSFLSGKAKG
jgi:hypothetical protein